MSELFVRLFLIEINKSDSMEAAFDRARERIVISPKHADSFSPIYVVNEDGDYIIRYMPKDRPTMQKVKHVKNYVLTMTAAWEQSTPMCVGKFRKLLEWNGIVLAARDDGAHGLHLVTWRCNRDAQIVENGNYTTSISGAVRDFVGRSGLVTKERLFDDAQLAIISSALSYRLEHDGNLYPDTENSIKSMLMAIEDSGDPDCD